MIKKAAGIPGSFFFLAMIAAHLVCRQKKWQAILSGEDIAYYFENFFNLYIAWLFTTS